jgi:4-amino-4-deoxy-L-arabinose transferase-like glycosyltransferase
VSARGRVAPLLVGAVVAAVFVALAFTSLRGDSATFDEPAHLSAAWSHLARGDYRMSPDHPPLVKHLAALPLLFLSVQMPPQDPAWQLRRTHEFGRRLLFRWNDGQRLLVASRCAIVGLGLALMAAVSVSARKRWGRAAGLLALLLCAFSPDVLAHARLVTTDLGAALFIFLAVMACERLAERPGRGRLVVAGLAVGAAFASKFSALVLVPVLLLLGALMVVRHRATAARVAVALAAMAALTVAVLWTAYGFHARFSPDPAVNASFDWKRMEPPQAIVRAPVNAARALSLLPDPYLYGFLRFFRHSEARPAFLMGKHSDHGFWYFFPVSFALKTPLPLLVLLLLGLALRATPGLPRAGPFVWVPVVVYALLTLTRGINIGHRHLLPLYPFLFVLAARAGAWAVQRWCAGARWPGALVTLLAAWFVAGTVRVHPHYLAYFNEAAGGPGNGYRLMVDSSLDWGQDLLRLRHWAEGHATPALKLSYFGTADPEYYRVPGQLLPGYMPPVPRKVVREIRPGDILAVSATNLQGVYIEKEALPLMERLRATEPLDSVGWSILIYRADSAWTLPPAGSADSPDLPADAEDDAREDE